MIASKTSRALLACALGMGGLIAGFKMLGLFVPELDHGWQTASFGASATLFFTLPPGLSTANWTTSLSANIGSACIGVACSQHLGQSLEVATLSALTLSVGMMSVLRVEHPPGGATALLAVLGGDEVRELGWLFPWLPIGFGTLWLLFVRSLVCLSQDKGRPTNGSKARGDVNTT